MVSAEEKLSELGEQAVLQEQEKYRKLAEQVSRQAEKRAALSEVVPQIHTRMVAANYAVGRGPIPSPQDDIAAHLHRLVLDLASTNDLMAKITGTPPPTALETEMTTCVLDRVDSLLDDCDMYARNLRLQLDKIYNRLTGG